MIKINHDFQIFVDAKRYERIINGNDVISAVLNLSLIMESFSNTYIKEICPQEFHDIFLDKKQKQHFKLSVAKVLGLPKPFIDAINKLSGIRNSFAHKLDYVITDDDISSFENSIEKISIEDICSDGPLNIKAVCDYLAGNTKVSGSMNYVSNKDIVRLVNATFTLAMKSALFTITELHRRGKLSLG